MATVYFLASGIRSFQKRDVVRSQRMMRNRVAAQFVTLACMVGYMGMEQADFRIAPKFQDSRTKPQGEK
jgi:Hypoxia induced protein conserved region